MNRPRTLLVISQTYLPDTPAVGQYMHEAAAEMVNRGWRAITYTSARAYDDPSIKFPRREVLDGVQVRRTPLSSFGKSRIAIRMLGGLIFVAQVALRGLFVRNLGGILVSTSPPFAPLAALFIRFFRRVPVTYWAMDINPDQVIAMGHATPRSRAVKLFNWLNRKTLSSADAVVTLDRFMGNRLDQKVPIADKLAVMPPWPHEAHLQTVEHADNPFRKDHGLTEKFVIMYSGNISPAHPVDTLLDAAKRIETELPNVLFLFIGGGLGKQRIEQFVEQEKVGNVRTLPYQPLEMLKYSLSAADVHLVSMGNDMVGIVHPCKIYGAMTVGRPVLVLGPTESHAGEIVSAFNCGWQVPHGDVDRAVAVIHDMVAATSEQRQAMGDKARSAIQQQFSMKSLQDRFCDVLERGAKADSKAEETPSPNQHAA
jgi:glycosyltransferase involved in cell wall biosynthesis